MLKSCKCYCFFALKQNKLKTMCFNDHNENTQPVERIVRHNQSTKKDQMIQSETNQDHMKLKAL